MPDKYNPQVGEIWWFGTTKKHYLIVSKDPPPEDFQMYKWEYKLYCIERGVTDFILHGNMNAHGEGWFKRVSP